MNTAASEVDLRFPIGKFDIAAYGSREENINTLADLPATLKMVVDGLTDEQLDTLERVIHGMVPLQLTDSHQWDEKPVASNAA